MQADRDESRTHKPEGNDECVYFSQSGRVITTSQPRHLKSPRENSNPLQKGILEFLTEQLSPSFLAEQGLSLNASVGSLPKRYTIYKPLLLLPANVFTTPPAWGAVYAALTPEQRAALYATISTAFSRYGITHIAMNAPIAPTDGLGRENRIRSPAGLFPLIGDFGSSSLRAEDEADLLDPSSQELEDAFWVRTVQNHAVVQVWAPLYTMFSRGNITEKARILGLEGTFEGLDAQSLKGGSVATLSVVDMYAGIGYFVFSYLKRGVKRVWGFEINGWSIEGIRRGCAENGWGCKVVRVRDYETLDSAVSSLVAGLTNSDKVVVFHGDNSFAADVLGRVKMLMESRSGPWDPVRHVNLGLLPSSRMAWENACKVLDPVRGGWLHVHENVDIKEIEGKKEDITVELEGLWSQVNKSPASAQCRHVEFVKTYAPGVMHCVFDVALTPGQKP